MAGRKNYTENDIQVFGAIDGIRKRPTMYIGSLDSHGIFHLLKEVVDNAVDEFLAGRNTAVYISTDGVTVTVGDDGQGIPTGIHKKTKRPTIETVFTENHAGGKFGSGAYGATRGVHGVGVTATNACSEVLTVASKYSGLWEQVDFAYGKVTTQLRKKKPVDMPAGMSPKGTVVQYRPDAKLFDKKAKLSIPEVEHWLMMNAYFNAKLRIEFYNEKTKKHTVYCFEKGIDDLLDKLNREEKIHELGRVSQSTVDYDLALSWSDSPNGYNTILLTNTLVNTKGGSHDKVLWTALATALEKYTSKGQEFEPVDLRYGTTSILNAKLEEPKFSSQTKERLSDPRVKTFEEPIVEVLTKFFAKNKELAKTLVERAVIVYEARTKSTLDKDLARKLNQGSKGGTLLPGKLTAAPKAKPEDRELFLVEGDSAGGPAISARTNVYAQEILCLKGKPINAARVEVERYSANEEVFNILLAMGYKPSSKDPYETLRVKGKLIILTDPDVDGAHISLLLLVLLATVLPKLFDMGIVHVVDAPEYMATYKGKRYYGNTRTELSKALPKGVVPEVQHIKGWGEIAPVVLREIAFDPKMRKLVKITTKKVSKIKKFLSLMSDDGQARKKLLGL